MIMACLSGPCEQAPQAGGCFVTGRIFAGNVN